MSLCASLLLFHHAAQSSLYSFFFGYSSLVSSLCLQPWSHKSSFTENIQQNRNVNLTNSTMVLVPTTASIPPCCGWQRANKHFRALNSSTKTTRLQLDVDFRPSKYSVICGRGKAKGDHAGNHRLRDLAGKFVENYRWLTVLNTNRPLLHIVARTRERWTVLQVRTWRMVRSWDHFARGKVSAMFAICCILNTDHLPRPRLPVAGFVDQGVAAKRRSCRNGLPRWFRKSFSYANFAGAFCGWRTDNVMPV
jgi:hypothetical protein